MAVDSSVVDRQGVSAKPPHVLVVPYPSQGHANPAISIAHYLAASSISVTLVQAIDEGTDSDPITYKSSAHPLAHNGNHVADEMPQIRIEVITSGIDHSQPIMLRFKKSIEVMHKEITVLLQKLMMEENAPTCLLIDSSFGWGGAVAVEFGLSRVDLWTSSASAFCLGLHVPDLVARGLIPATEEGAKDKIVDFISGLSPFRISDMPKSLLAEAGLENPGFVFLSSNFQHAKAADRILVNTIYELENSVVEALHTEDHVPIYTIGPLFMTSMAPSAPVPSLLQEDDSCLLWLDQRQKSSVLYIAFGSLAVMEDNVFEEVALGLEASGESFLWVIRPDGYKNKASVEELLPEGFMERTQDRGLVISWAPQVAVLGHPSVGAFLTHCGWNSVLESLSNGVPMLGFPQIVEQNTNLKFLVHDWKVGLPLLQDRVDTQSVERTRVQDAVTAIMRGDEGLQARVCAGEWKEIVEKATHGSSKANLQKLVDDLKYGCLKHPSQ